MQHKNENQRGTQEYQAHCAPKTQRKIKNVPSMVANSVMEKTSYDLGCTKTDRETKESIPSPYAREIQHLTLKDIETYLIPGG